MNILRSTKNTINDSTSIDSAIYDLMAGLMIVFVLISIGFMVQVQEETQKVQEINNQYQEQSELINSYDIVKSDINDDLINAFGEDLDLLNMEITPENTIRFNSPEVLFSNGQSEISDDFKFILDEFFPIYLDLIYSNYKDSIKEIRIEGHTSTEWSQDVSPNVAYFNNMRLSQDRTRSVLEYVMNLPSSEPYRDWLVANMTANGLSSSHPIINPVTGKEDSARSRRVEFKIVTLI